ncbi:nuclear transport factor 2 family protein [Kutzneria sp. NPDC052558]|uniref:nuclear transport factor 2 family protein n=1 Tax=Kutzneria sp. NPDC052558 TaxID=3364121 RepID=UPI0037C8283C
MEKTVRHQEFFHALFTWCADLCAGQAKATDDEVRRFWTEDGRMVTNGRVEAAGVSALRAHFELFPQRYRTVEILVPFRRYIESGDDVAIEYDIVGELKQGAVAIATGETDRQEVRVMANFTLVDGRISEMREVAAKVEGRD